MPRDVVVGNGRLAIAFDDQLRIRDLFFPRVGLENHIGGHRFLIGVWVEGPLVGLVLIGTSNPFIFQRLWSVNVLLRILNSELR